MLTCNFLSNTLLGKVANIFWNEEFSAQSKFGLSIAFFFTICIAACVGLKTALVEKDDFASATSSRSTKLIHGGVRYLQKAVFNLSYEQV